jgi:hypothetical protein
MRHAMLGLLAGIGLTAAMAGWPAGAEPVNGFRGTGGDLITHVVRNETGSLTVIVIAAQTRVMAVYHVQDGSGEIQLKSVRPFTWDLQLDGHNATKPLPEEIRKMLQSQ